MEPWTLLVSHAWALLRAVWAETGMVVVAATVGCPIPPAIGLYLVFRISS